MSQTETLHEEPGHAARKGRLSWVSMTIIFLNLLALFLAIFAYGFFGSIDRAVRFSRGWTVSVDRPRQSFGTARPKERRTISFHLRNEGRTPIRVIGCRTSCSCVAPDQMPFGIGPGEVKEFRVSIVHMPATPGNLSLSAVLYTDSPAQPELELTIEGEVRGP
jgi:hypothetical protein